MVAMNQKAPLNIDPILHRDLTEAGSFLFISICRKALHVQHRCICEHSFDTVYASWGKLSVHRSPCGACESLWIMSIIRKKKLNANNTKSVLKCYTKTKYLED